MAAIFITQSPAVANRPSNDVFWVRRITALVLVTFLVLAVAQMIGSFRASDPALSGPRAKTHVVQPGESLWSIAAAERPVSDTVHVVEVMMRLNGSSVVRVGQELQLPD